MRKILLSLTIITALFVTSCKNNDDDMKTSTSSKFKVTIENVLPKDTTKPFFQSGALGTEGQGPGKSFMVKFNAGKGAYLSFATMMVKSNDFFFAPDNAGIKLFDDSGVALVGDVTDKVFLWDAGTEINQPVGVATSTGQPLNGNKAVATDPNNKVRKVTTEAPTVNKMIKVMLAYNSAASEFTLTINNISGDVTVGDAPGTPIAPGVYVVHYHSDGKPLFTDGQPDTGHGLKTLAEDGKPASLKSYLESLTGYTSPFAPGVYAVHNSSVKLFEKGKPDAGHGLKALAEDGKPTNLNTYLGTVAAISDHGIISKGAPIGAGTSTSFTITANPGDYLSFANMLIDTNDLFFAPTSDTGISLFNGDMPISGDVTSQISLWDAGTEMNQYPGAGSGQPRRGNTTVAKDPTNTVRLENDAFTYPAVNASIKVTITPN